MRLPPLAARWRRLTRCSWRMAADDALGKLFRTTAFKLTLVYLVVFALFAAFCSAISRSIRGALSPSRSRETVDAEIAGLAEQYNSGGIRQLMLVVDARSRRPGSSLYLVTDSDRRRRSPAMSARSPPACSTRPAGPKRFIAGSTSRRRPSTARWCACRSFPAASGCWSGAISRSATGLWRHPRRRRVVGRAWSSCSALPAGSSSRGACCAASTP